MLGLKSLIELTLFVKKSKNEDMFILFLYLDDLLVLEQPNLGVRNKEDFLDDIFLWIQILQS